MKRFPWISLLLNLSWKSNWVRTTAWIIQWAALFLAGVASASCSASDWVSCGVEFSLLWWWMWLRVKSQLKNHRVWKEKGKKMKVWISSDNIGDDLWLRGARSSHPFVNLIFLMILLNIGFDCILFIHDLFFFFFYLKDVLLFRALSISSFGVLFLDLFGVMLIGVSWSVHPNVFFLVSGRNLSSFISPKPFQAVGCLLSLQSSIPISLLCFLCIHF